MEIGTTLRVDPIPTRTTTAAIPPVSTLFWSIRGLDNGAKHKCHLEVIGSAVSLAPRTQYEAFRIVREAINNAIKHADATIVDVCLEYPAERGQPVQLTIKDNGRNAQTVSTPSGHRGVRYMQESARAAGGKLSIEVEPGQSTSVRFMFPVEATPSE